jgi:putative transposase
VLPRRWVVERTLARLGRNRRLSQDDEALPASEVAWIYAAASRLLLRRLATSCPFPHRLLRSKGRRLTASNTTFASFD